MNEKCFNSTVQGLIFVVTISSLPLALAEITKIRLYWICFPKTNTLAYFGSSSVTKRRFISSAAGEYTYEAFKLDP